MKRTFLLITILLLLLCGCRQNEHTAIFQGNELLNNPLAIRNDGVCFEASDDLCSMLQSLQGKKSSGQLRDACAHFRFVISRTTQI